jgi:hypothetical protein
MEYEMNDYSDDYHYHVDSDDQWQMPPAQIEELPVGLIEDQI